MNGQLLVDVFVQVVSYWLHKHIGNSYQHDCCQVTLNLLDKSKPFGTTTNQLIFYEFLSENFECNF